MLPSHTLGPRYMVNFLIVSRGLIVPLRRPPMFSQITAIKTPLLGLILLKLFDLVHGFGDIQKMPKNDYLKIVKKNCSVAQFLSLTPPKSGVWKGQRRFGNQKKFFWPPQKHKLIFLKTSPKWLDYYRLSWIVIDYGLSWTVLDCHGLFWTVMDCLQGVPKKCIFCLVLSFWPWERCF